MGCWHMLPHPPWPPVPTTWSAGFHSWHTWTFQGPSSGTDPWCPTNLRGLMAIKNGLSHFSPHWFLTVDRNKQGGPLPGVLSAGGELQTRLVCGRLLWNAWSLGSHTPRHQGPLNLVGPSLVGSQDSWSPWVGACPAQVQGSGSRDRRGPSDFSSLCRGRTRVWGSIEAALDSGSLSAGRPPPGTGSQDLIPAAWMVSPTVHRLPHVCSLAPAVLPDATWISWHMQSLYVITFLPWRTNVTPLEPVVNPLSLHDLSFGMRFYICSI